MSEIKSSGTKGYVVMGAAIALLLFVFLVVYIYKANNSGVPESPEYYGQLLLDTVEAQLA
ncbi:hypothetical protein QWY85_02130 [Neolewinella lacunae]|uniref:Uncharacterized protein n=1 Tax=Neolewinella lacunae TaxID=1517758 RepID=A0A923PTT7_9BACT|nr:hypothetical protein [Neolewinella lacunae]MBC6996697.1 hypothetical protein [Neolewinella lacunae]MDN3633438.1 hypothetical protein [Neolewinella lacunae]